MDKETLVYSLANLSDRSSSPALLQEERRKHGRKDGNGG